MRNFRNIVYLLVLATSLSACQQQTDVSQDNDRHDYIAVEVATPLRDRLSDNNVFSGQISSDQLVTVTPALSMPATVQSVDVALGEHVAAGQQLASFSSDAIDDQIASAKAQYEVAQASYQRQLETHQLAQAQLARTKALYESGAVSKVEYDQAKLNASSSQLSLLKEQLEQAKANYQIQLDGRGDKTLQAPRSGVITAIALKEGGQVSAQSGIEILGDEPLEVTFDVPQAMRQRLQLGQEVTVTTGDDDALRATIQYISEQTGRQSNLYQAIAAFEHGLTENYYSGMTVAVTLAKQRQEVLTVPLDAVLGSAQTTYVYIAEDDKAEKRFVETGADNGEVIEILSGLSAQDRVVVKGQDFLDGDQTIKVIGGN